MHSRLNSIFRQKKRKFLILGAAGAGMQALSEILSDLGHELYLHDDHQMAKKSFLKSAALLKARSFCQEQWAQIDIVLYSSALELSHDLRQTALKLEIPSYERNDFLVQLSDFYRVIAFTGTHGKTTATALAQEAFDQAGIVHDYCIGGCLKKTGRSGSGLALAHYFQSSKASAKPFLLLELDESRPFSQAWKIHTLCLLNLKEDHLSNFAHSKENYRDNIFKIMQQATYVLLSEKLPGLEEQEHKNITFIKEQTLSHDELLKDKKRQYPFCAVSQGVFQSSLFVQFVFQHLNFTFKGQKNLLEGFSGVRYRFETLIDFKNIILLRDYGHMPDELRNFSSALKHLCLVGPKIIFFQPHKYSRTAQNYKEFIKAIKSYEQIYILPTFEAGESPKDGMCHVTFTQKLQEYVLNAQALESHDQISEVIEEIYFRSLTLHSKQDFKTLIAFQGAGSVQTIADEQREYLLNLKSSQKIIGNDFT